VETEAGLHDSNLGTLTGNNQVSRIARPRLTVICRDKREVDWLFEGFSTRNFDVGAIREESRIPRRERVIGRAGISTQMPLDHAGPIRILKRLTHIQQMEIQSAINRG